MAPRASSKRSDARKKSAKKAAPPTRAQSRVKGKPRAAATRTAKAAKPSAKPSTNTAQGSGRIEVRNVNVPGYRNSVDASKYGSMRTTLFSFLPRGPPGMTQAEMMEAARAKADRAHFPGGDKSEWWMKTVQLDQEARGAMKRSDTKPLRWWQC